MVKARNKMAPPGGKFFNALQRLYESVVGRENEKKTAAMKEGVGKLTMWTMAATTRSHY